MVLKKYLACRTFRKCQPHSNESCLSIPTYTYKIEAENQLHNCVCGALSIKDGGQMLNSKKAIYEIQRLTDICSYNATAISEASCRTFHYEKFLLEI